MPSGLEDWIRVRTSTALDFSNELAELAARLGSPYRYYRSGNVVAFTSFEDGDDYVEFIGNSAPNIAIISTDVALFGAKSAKLSVTSAGGSAQFIKRVPFYDASKNALQLAVNLRDLTSIWNITFGTIRGGNIVRATIYFDQPGDILQYENSGGTKTTFATYPSGSASGNHEWLMVKLFVDFALEKYDKIDVNGAIYDLSANDLFKVASTARRQNFFASNLLAPSAGTSLVYVDSVIYTVNDPN